MSGFFEEKVKRFIEWTSGGRGEGGKARRVWWGGGGGGLQKGRGYLSVMDKRTGECGQFQSSVSGMVGGGGGRSASVIMREYNGIGEAV